MDGTNGSFIVRRDENLRGAKFTSRRDTIGYVHAAAARGTVMENGLWCSKARSLWPTIVYFGL